MHNYKPSAIQQRHKRFVIQTALLLAQTLPFKSMTDKQKNIKLVSYPQCANSKPQLLAMVMGDAHTIYAPQLFQLR